MQQKHSSSATIAKGALSLFGLVVVLVNALVTWQFGSYYLNHAFGIQQPAMAAIVGGAYAVTFLDVASLVWLFTFMRLAETSAQRGISLAASIIAFVGSLLATVYMLASGTAGALSAYTESISTAAQVAMIAIVVTHAVLLVLYLLRGRGEMVTQTTINATTSATGEALTLAAQNVQNMVPRLAQDIGAAIETQILAALSFTRQHDGSLLYTPTEQRSQLPAPPAAGAPDDGWRPYPYSTDGAQQHVEPPAQQPVRDTHQVQERFHTEFIDEHGTVPVETNLNRHEFNEIMRLAEDAKRRGELANFTNGRTNGR